MHYSTVPVAPVTLGNLLYIHAKATKQEYGRKIQLKNGECDLEELVEEAQWASCEVDKLLLFFSCRSVNTCSSAVFAALRKDSERYLRESLVSHALICGHYSVRLAGLLLENLLRGMNLGRAFAAARSRLYQESNYFHGFLFSLIGTGCPTLAELDF